MKKASSLLIILALCASVTEKVSAQERCEDVIDTVQVFSSNPVDNTTGIISSSQNLPAGVYTLRASGTYIYFPPATQDGGIADAQFFYASATDPVNSSGVAQWMPASQTADPNHLEVRVNDNTNVWGSFQSNHIYNSSINHQGGVMNFTIVDSYYPDNQGSITVDIIKPCEDEGENENPESTPVPTATPEAKTTKSSTDSSKSSQSGEIGKHGRLGVDKLQCQYPEFVAVYDATENGNPRTGKDIEVTFTYKGESKKSTTNENGRASTTFTYKGKGTLESSATEGFPSLSQIIPQYELCGESTQTVIFGTETYSLAPTGRSLNRMTAILGLSGIAAVIGLSIKKTLMK